MLHIFAQFYFIFSQCTFHVLKHCVVLWLNTQKIFWKECRLVLLLELTWGKRPQLILLYLYPWSLIHKNQEIAKPIWNSLIWYCSFSPVPGHDLTLCHEMCFLFVTNNAKQNFSSINPDWMFPLYLGSWSPRSKYMIPSLVNRNTWNQLVAIVSCSASAWR